MNTASLQPVASCIKNCEKDGTGSFIIFTRKIMLEVVRRKYASLLIRYIWCSLCLHHHSQQLLSAITITPHPEIYLLETLLQMNMLIVDFNDFRSLCRYVDGNGGNFQSQGKIFCNICCIGLNFLFNNKVYAAWSFFFFLKKKSKFIVYFWAKYMQTIYFQ